MAFCAIICLFLFVGKLLSSLKMRGSNHSSLGRLSLFSIFLSFWRIFVVSIPAFVKHGSPFISLSSSLSPCFWLDMEVSEVSCLTPIISWPLCILQHIYGYQIFKLKWVLVMFIITSVWTIRAIDLFDLLKDRIAYLSGKYW